MGKGDHLEHGVRELVRLRDFAEFGNIASHTLHSHHTRLKSLITSDITLFKVEDMSTSFPPTSQGAAWATSDFVKNEIFLVSPLSLNPPALDSSEDDFDSGIFTLVSKTNNIINNYKRSFFKKLDLLFR